MPNGTYGGVRGTETKVGQKTFVSRPTRFSPICNQVWQIRHMDSSKGKDEKNGAKL